MKKIKKSHIYIALSIVAYGVVCLALSLHYKLTPLVTVLMAFSFGTILYFLSFISRAVIKLNNLWVRKEQKRIDFYKNMARQKGKKDYMVGSKKQHVVWAKNLIDANKIYFKKIKPLEAKHPKKEFYYIDIACNNVTLKK